MCIKFQSGIFRSAPGSLRAFGKVKFYLCGKNNTIFLTGVVYWIQISEKNNKTAEVYLHAGESIVMPAGHPHAVCGEEKFRLLLVVVF